MDSASYEKTLSPWTKHDPASLYRLPDCFEIANGEQLKRLILFSPQNVCIQKFAYLATANPIIAVEPNTSAFIFDKLKSLTGSFKTRDYSVLVISSGLRTAFTSEYL